MKMSDIILLRSNRTAEAVHKNSTEIRQETADFLAQGGKVQHIPPGVYARVFSFEGTGNAYSTGSEG